MSEPYLDDFDVAFSGPPGESVADILRRTGQYGVLPTDTDAQAMSKLYAQGVSAGEELAALAFGLRGVVGAGTLAERQAYTFRNGGVADVPPGGIWIRTETDDDGDPTGWIRVDVWRLAGQLHRGVVVPSTNWYGFKTEAEMDNMSLDKTGLLPIARQEGMQEARNDIDNLYAVSIADFKATALSDGEDPDVELSWSLYGVRPDKLMVSVGSYTATVDGGATKLRLPRWSDTNTLGVVGNSLSDPTDDPNKWPRVMQGRRGSDLVASARYSSDIRQLPRIGLTPLLVTVQGGNIPASGTANVTAVNGVATSDPNFLAYPESFLSTGDAGLTTGVTLDGVVISGGKSYAARASVVNAGSSAYKIAQVGGTAPLVLSGPALFVPGLKYEMDRPDVAFVVWLGNNIFYSSVPNQYGDHTNPMLWDILDQLDAYIGGRQALFLPVIPDADWPAEGSPAEPVNGVDYGNHQTSAMNAANTRTRTRYPHRHALAAGKTLLQSLQALAAGPGSADDVAAGLTPRNIRTDTLHLNDLGNLGVADHNELALAALPRPPIITDETVFSIVPVWTRPADYTIFPVREPETFTGEAVTAGLVRGFESRIIQEVYDMVTAGTTFEDQSVTITEDMLDGTAPVLAADPSRRIVRMFAPASCTFGFDDGASDGAFKLDAETSTSFVGAECPRNAVFLIEGLALDARLSIKVG